METVTLWHGTTESAAKQIAADGFKRVDTARVIAMTAAECGVDAAGTIAALRAGSRFVIHDSRDDGVSFATSKDRAVRWTQRAPEARWEALWGVWWQTHGGYDAMPSPWGDPTAAAWHAQHFFADRPAVLEVKVPVSRIQDNEGESATREAVSELIALGVPEVPIALPIPSEWIVNCHIVPRQIDFIAAAGLLGVTTTELTRRVNAGEIPECRSPDDPGLDAHYWEINELLPFLQVADRSEFHRVTLPPSGPSRPGAECGA